MTDIQKDAYDYIFCGAAILGTIILLFLSYWEVIWRFKVHRADKKNKKGGLKSWLT